MGIVTVRDLRNYSAEALARVGRGETLTVTRYGQPVASLEPLPRPALSAGQLVARRRALPQVDARDLRADIDAVLDPSL